MVSNSNDLFLLVGLGNPGKNYESTRHNVGFMFLDYIKAHESDWSSMEFKENDSFSGSILKSELSGVKVIALKPKTFMNLSGDSVSAVANYFQIPPEKIIIFYDDLDLPLGDLRLRTKSGDGGHKGIRSIAGRLGSNAYINFRFGIGRPIQASYEISDWVLSKLKSSEKELLEDCFEAAVAILKVSLKKGLHAAQNQLAINAKSAPKSGS